MVIFHWPVFWSIMAQSDGSKAMTNVFHLTELLHVDNRGEVMADSSKHIKLFAGLTLDLMPEMRASVDKY